MENSWETEDGGKTEDGREMENGCDTTEKRIEWLRRQRTVANAAVVAM